MGGQQSTESGFTAKSTAMDVSEGVSLKGKIAIVTGANNGIGLETTRALAVRGATVYMGCRDAEKAEAAVNSIRASMMEAYEPKKTDPDSTDAGPDGDLKVIPLDLNSLASVRAFADAFLAEDVPLHILICNAGVMAFPDRRETEDGLEAQMQINHFGHFLLINLLRDKLVESAPARCVIVASHRHTQGSINWDDLQGETTYAAEPTYNMSKLCNVLTAFEFARQLEGTGVNVYTLHPGVVATSLFKNNPKLNFFTTVGNLFLKSPPQGAATSVYAAVHPNLENVTGVYLDNSNVKAAAPQALVEEDAQRLWKVSLEIVGLADSDGGAGPAEPAAAADSDAVRDADLDADATPEGEAETAAETAASDATPATAEDVADENDDTPADSDAAEEAAGDDDKADE